MLNQAETVVLLLKSGANYSTTNLQGKKPVDLASSREVVKILEGLDCIIKGIHVLRLW